MTIKYRYDLVTDSAIPRYLESGWHRMQLALMVNITLKRNGLGRIIASKAILKMLVCTIVRKQTLIIILYWWKLCRSFLVILKLI